MIPLNIHHVPISTTFALYSDGKYHLADPNLTEESFADGQISLIINEHKEICSIVKAGGEAITEDLVILLSKISAAKSADVAALIKETINNSKVNNKTL